MFHYMNSANINLSCVFSKKNVFANKKGVSGNGYTMPNNNNNNNNLLHVQNK